jgi:hypothetical protein
MYFKNQIQLEISVYFIVAKNTCPMIVDFFLEKSQKKINGIPSQFKDFSS